MKGLLFLLIKYGGIVLFVLFECIAFYLVINHNAEQRSIYANSTNVFSGYLNTQVTALEDFGELRGINDSLQLENAKLIEKIINLPGVQLTPVDIPFQKSFKSDQYKLIPTHICGKNTRLRNNYFTLCKGSKDGLYKDMGIISETGIIGRISEVSDHYALVITMLNIQSGISALIHDKSFAGTLIWDVDDTNEMTLTGIPKHAELMVGDTIITSGYSTVFPPGIMIGRIKSYELPPGDNNYRISVSLANDILDEKIIYAIDNKRKEEQLLLEQNIID